MYYTPEDTLNSAIEVFGKKAQIIKAIEELNELGVELAKYLNNQDVSVCVCEEIADVEIMLTQLKQIFDAKEISSVKKFKLERLASFIKFEVERKEAAKSQTVKQD